MKTAISVTLDHKCVVWLNNQAGPKSRVINKLIIEGMRGELDDELTKPYRYCQACGTRQHTNAPSCTNRTCKNHGMVLWDES